MSNPYAPPNPESVSTGGGGSARDPALAELEPAPRWLAVVVTFLSGLLLLGLGQLVLGNTRRAVRWLAIGWSLAVLFVLSIHVPVPPLLLVVFIGALSAWVWALIDTGRAKVSRPWTKARAAALAVGTFVFSLVVSAVNKRWVAEAYQVPSGNMMPTLLIGDHFFAAKGRGADRGAVIVFDYPADPEVQYVKRVVAMGGETLEIRDNIVFVNGRALAQTKLDERCPPVPRELGLDDQGCSILEEQNGRHRYRILHYAGFPSSFGPTTVPAGHVFVMGDNRHNSNDSRMWGTEPDEMVRGRAQFVWWSGFKDETRWQRIGQRIE